MSDKFLMNATSDYWGALDRLVEKEKRSTGRIGPRESNVYNGPKPPIRFITLSSYSTYVLRTYSSGAYDVDSYDLDGEWRGGQEYLTMVDGETPVDVALWKWDADGNSKQLISFVGDSISGSVKLAIDGAETDPIDLSANILTETYLREKIEALPAIGAGNVDVSLFPGRWLVEFIGSLAGETLDLFVIDKPFASVYEVHVHYTNWKDAREESDVIYPIPLVGEYDGGDNVINDAVAAGSIGTAKFFPGVGYVVDVSECRSYNGDGSPDL